MLRLRSIPNTSQVLYLVGQLTAPYIQNMVFENTLDAKPTIMDRLRPALPLLLLAAAVVLIIVGLHGGGPATHAGALVCIALAAIAWKTMPRRKATNA